MGSQDTHSESIAEPGAQSAPVPGALLVFSRDTPMFRPVRLVPGALTVWGREDIGGAAVPDERVSRQHVEVRFEHGLFHLKDLGSRNGITVDGEKVTQRSVRPGAVLRLSGTLLLLVDDVRPALATAVETVKGLVLGPAMRAVYDRAGVARLAGGHLLVHGESGAGKEGVARAFHEAAARPGPLVSVNCATIPATVAERLLFGAVKGAYSDAKTDQVGYLEAADGGVLFLDEVAELDLAVQAKLLRAVETREVLRLGATAPTPVRVQVVGASHQELRQAVTQGRFRQDLFYRLAQDEVRLPPLRERREELPWLMSHALEGRAPLHVSAVEAALLRPWPGNVRELLSEVRRAALAALGQPLRAEHLSPTAGTAAPGPAKTVLSSMTPVPAAPNAGAKDERPELTAGELTRALAEAGGNVSAAARALDLHRTQLYRLMRKHGLAVDEER